MKTITVGWPRFCSAPPHPSPPNAWKEAEVGGAKIYTDANGMTLYTYDKDEKGKIELLRQMRHQLAAAEGRGRRQGAKARWTVVNRTDGTKMWAYDGKPVYTFIKDKKAGDMNGDGVGGVWHTAKAD